MSSINIDEKINEIAEIFVINDLADHELLRDLRNKFFKIGQCGIDHDLPEITSISIVAEKAINNMLINKIQSPTDDLKIINKAISILQRLISENPSQQEIELPTEFEVTLNANNKNFESNIKKANFTKEENKPKPEAIIEKDAIKRILDEDAEIFNEFVIEVLEHIEEANTEMLILEKDAKNTESINKIFRAFHNIKGTAKILDFTEFESIAHQAENILEQARDKEIILSEEEIDIIFRSLDNLKELIDAFKSNLESDSKSNDNNDAEICDFNNDSSSCLKINKTGNEIDSIVGDKIIGDKYREKNNQKTDHLYKNISNLNNLGGVIKVNAVRLDLLVDLIGEMVIAESMVSQSAKLTSLNEKDLVKQLRQLDKITRELQEIATSLRMVSLKQIFRKMARLVRDLSKESGKEVDFDVIGEETELDKNIVDKISDPLVHLLRNAIDHGLEDEFQERIKNNKPKSGRIQLKAYYKSGNVYIEVKDDGRGLDVNKILEKAQKSGFSYDNNLNESDIFQLILQPGFSTSKEVTEISGRGVGLDIVKRNIDSLNGHIELKSEPGKGSTFTLRLPLTLAIIDGMVVRVGDERFIIPTLSIIRSIRPGSNELSTVLSKGEMLNVEDKLIPLFRLYELFEIQKAMKDPTQAIVVVVEDEGHLAGLLVDELLGQQQIVIKTLRDSLSNIPGISGGAIMPDGKVSLIVDIKSLLNFVDYENIFKSKKVMRYEF